MDDLQQDNQNNKKTFLSSLTAKIILVLIIFAGSAIIIISGIYFLAEHYKTSGNQLHNKIEKTLISILMVQSDYKYDIESQKSTPETNIKNKIDIVVPDYKVSNSEVTGYDYVSIPGGTLLLETDKIEIPVYKILNTYPEDIKIQKVTLINKSGIKKETGLNLPPVINKFGKNENSKISLVKSCYAATENNWYPNDFFSWTTRENPSGKEELEIVIFPFHHNNKTKESIFYKNFSFKIDYIKSNIRILHLHESKYNYKLTEPINLDFTIFNFDNTKTYYIESKLFIQSENYTEKLEKQSIKIIKGQNDFVISLKPNYNFKCVFDECDVLYTVKIIDKNDLLLDIEKDSFYISKK